MNIWVSKLKQIVYYKRKRELLARFKLISPDTIFLLDKTLEIITTNCDIETSRMLKLDVSKILMDEHGIPVMTSRLDLIIDKLQEDGYVNQNEMFVFKKYNAEFFLQNNGYAGIIETVKRQKRNQSRKDWLLIVGSFLAGIGTLLLFGMEIYKIKEGIK